MVDSGGSWPLRSPRSSVLAAMPYATRALVAATGNPQLDSELALERLPTTDPLGAAVARLWIEQQAPNMDYYRAMTASNATQSALRPAVPDTTFASTPIDVRAPLPHVFILMIDSLRRDYLSPYNPAVTFTPAIAQARRRQLCLPQRLHGLWRHLDVHPVDVDGHAVDARAGARSSGRSTRSTRCITIGGYDFVINDYTVAETRVLDTADLSQSRYRRASRPICATTSRRCRRTSRRGRRASVRCSPFWRR